MVAGVITFYNPSYIPDLVVGVFIAYLNIDAAKKVWNSVK
jgi:Co/Zn/Cd efflux system component